MKNIVPLLILNIMHKKVLKVDRSEYLTYKDFSLRFGLRCASPQSNFTKTS